MKGRMMQSDVTTQGLLVLVIDIECSLRAVRSHWLAGS